MLALIDGDIILYHSIWATENIEEAKTRLNDVLQFWTEGSFAEEYLVAVGGPNNFRDTIYPDYKRSPSRQKSKDARAPYFNDLKQYLVGLPNTVLCTGFETDDMIRIWANQATKAGDPYIVCSIDKDLDCIPGKHWNPVKDLFYTMTEEEADRFYWQQILTGDSTDNIPGLPGVGPAKANKILEDANTHEERKQRVIDAYKKHYNDDWYSYLLSNGRLIHLWRTIDDHFSIKKKA